MDRQVERQIGTHVDRYFNINIDKQIDTWKQRLKDRQIETKLV